MSRAFQVALFGERDAGFLLIALTYQRGKGRLQAILSILAHAEKLPAALLPPGSVGSKPQLPVVLEEVGFSRVRFAELFECGKLFFWQGFDTAGDLHVLFEFSES